jgi:hypothetical protein
MKMKTLEALCALAANRAKLKAKTLWLIKFMEKKKYLKDIDIDMKSIPA